MGLPQTKTMTAAQAIVESMKRENVKYAFCVPGESYLDVLDALHDEESIKVISNRHEGGAAFMAEGYAKSTLKPGVVLATRGVGATNLSISLHTAYQDSTPMVVLIGQVHSKFRGREGFHEVDLDVHFKTIAKWATEIRDPERVPEIMHRAFRIATSGRPGPVVISLPEDVLPIETEMNFGPTINRPKPAPAADDVTQLEQILKDAKKPLIIAGGGVKSAQAENLLIEFAEKHDIPVMAAFRRHDVFPHNHRLYAGHLGLGPHQSELTTIKEADVLLTFGSRLCEVTTQSYTAITPDKTLVHVDIDFDSIGKVYAPHLGIVADMKEALLAFQQIKTNPTWKAWASERRDAYKEDSSLDITEKDPINKEIIALLSEKLPEGSLLTVDAGNFAGWVHSFYPFKQKHTFVGPTCGAMGYGMPAALGAKLAHPDKQVIALGGDGGVMMTVQELETAAREEIPIINVIFNNYMYGTIRMHQEMHFPEKVIATDLGDVSFAKLAKSLGAEGHTVKTAEQFAHILDEVLKSDRKKPVVIEVITTKEQISVSSTITELREKAIK